MRNEILKIQAERRDQQQRYTERLQSKDQTIQCKFYTSDDVSLCVELLSVNESIKAEITELKRKLRLEELEQRIKDLVDQN